MRTFFILLWHEMRTLFFAPATYVAAVLFLLLMGILYHGIIKDYSATERSIAPAAVFFQLFSLPVLFMVPLLTMRALAEERRLGTLETLLSTPVSSISVVATKFLAAWAFYCLLWLSTASFPLLASYVTNQAEVSRLLMDKPAYVGGFTFVCLSGLFFVAVGIFASSLTRSQLVAGMLCFSILFIVILGPQLIEAQDIAQWSDWLRTSLNYMDISRHREDFARGIIDSRPFLFYITNSGLVLGLATLVVEAKA